LGVNFCGVSRHFGARGDQKNQNKVLPANEKEGGQFFKINWGFFYLLIFLNLEAIAFWVFFTWPVKNEKVLQKIGQKNAIPSKNNRPVPIFWFPHAPRIKKKLGSWTWNWQLVGGRAAAGPGVFQHTRCALVL
jgi:hypothetical protein